MFYCIVKCEIKVDEYLMFPSYRTALYKCNPSIEKLQSPEISTIVLSENQATAKSPALFFALNDAKVKYNVETNYSKIF